MPLLNLALRNPRALRHPSLPELPHLPVVRDDRSLRIALVTEYYYPHLGGVCEGGVLCTGNRDLYDDFGVQASPTTGFASIIYSDDPYQNDANHKANATFNCTAAESDSSTCDHTNIATQTAGTRIFTTKGK